MDAEKKQPKVQDTDERCLHILSVGLDLVSFGYGRTRGRYMFKYCPNCGTKIADLPTIKDMYRDTYEEDIERVNKQ